MSILFNVLCVVGALLFAAIMWRLVIEATGGKEKDEHEGGGIG